MKKLFLLFSLLIPVVGFGQSYTIDWYKISGGLNGFEISAAVGGHGEVRLRKIFAERR